jgi:hypothetical protein
MIEEGIRDSRCRSEKRDKNPEWDYEKYQIDDSGNEANPEPSVRQRCGCGGAVARSFHLLFPSPLSCCEYGQLPVLFHARDVYNILQSMGLLTELPAMPVV